VGVAGVVPSRLPLASNACSAKYGNAECETTTPEASGPLRLPSDPGEAPPSSRQAATLAPLQLPASLIEPSGRGAIVSAGWVGPVAPLGPVGPVRPVVPEAPTVAPST